MTLNNNKGIFDPEMSDVLDNLKNDIFKSLHCCLVGNVVGVDYRSQTVSVQLGVKKLISIGNDGRRVLEDYPVLVEVPFIFLRGGSSYISVNIMPGDPCVVFFADRDFENWYFSNTPLTPQALRSHDLSDGIAFIGLSNAQTMIEDYFEDGIRIQSEASKIELSENLIASVAEEFTHAGNMTVNGTLDVSQNTTLAADLQVDQNSNVTGNSGVGGNLTVAGTFTLNGQVITGTGTGFQINTDLIQLPGNTLQAGNGASGSFQAQSGQTVTVLNGIVTSIS